jgi:hypothetical protein
MHANDTTERIQSAIANIDGSLEHRIARFTAESCAQIDRLKRLLDELEHEIDDLSDERAQDRMRRLLGRLDGETACVKCDPSGLTTPDLFESLRALIVDLRHNY